MALDHTMMLGRYQGALAKGNMLKVTQGASALVSVSQQYKSGTQSYNVAKGGFTYGGRLFFPAGGHRFQDYWGWWAYHQEKDEAYQCMIRSCQDRIIPFFDRVVFVCYGSQGWGYSPFYPVDEVTAVNTYSSDHCIAGDKLHVLTAATGSYSWQYPFNSSWIWHGGLSNCYRLCEVDGDVYALCLVSGSPGTATLYKMVLSTWTPVGSSSINLLVSTYTTGVAFFKFNGKLFWAIAERFGGQAVRIFEMDKTTGASTERNSWLPAAWQGSSAGDYERVFEVRDDISNIEQVFLVRCNGIYGSGWEVYEFQEGPFTAVQSGSDVIYPYFGVIYDPDTKGADYKSAADSTPSSYVTTEIETYDLASNGSADIDPRYRQGGAESPPYSVCTEKSGVGSEGVTGLTTKPTGITLLSHLSDDFGDASIDEDLWEIVQPATYNWTYDGGFGFSEVSNLFQVDETGGAITFGPTTSSNAPSYAGIAVKSKWWVNGAFNFRFTLANLANLRTYSSRRYCLLVLVKLDAEEFYGFFVWNNSGTYYVNSLYCALDSNIVEAGSVATVIEGDVIEIARDGSDVWSMIVDPDGTPTDITPAGASYSGPVNVVMGGITIGTTLWASGTPWPGFSNFVASGAGTLSRYEGGVKHTYAWDHITDLGAGFTGDTQMFVDVQRT